MPTVPSCTLSLYQRLFKRAFDLCAALAGIVLLAPVMMLTALAIRLEDGHPALFVQARVGRGNRLFSMYKFRSMQPQRCDDLGSRSTAHNDERLTRVGWFIRRTSIDELPQLFNVLRGEMSIVGPRPHALGSRVGSRLFWEIDRQYWHRHALKPGMTGLAQVRGLRGPTEREEDLTRRLASDLEYARGWSMWTDLWIVIRTIRVLIHPRAF